MPEAITTSTTVIATGLRAYSKLLVHVLFTVVGAIVPLVDGGGDITQWLQVLAQTVVIAGIYIASNTVPGARYAKAIISATSAALAVLIPAVMNGLDGFTSGTLINMVAAIAGTLGVVAVADKTQDGTNVLDLTARLDRTSTRGGYPGSAAA